VHSPVPARTLSLPSMGKLVAWSDDWSFWRQGIPAFSFTDTAFLRHDHYHEISDTEEKLNYASMADVVWETASCDRATGQFGRDMESKHSRCICSTPSPAVTQTG
jgi:hypothetical protein